jgi:IS1 family transposase
VGKRSKRTLRMVVNTALQFGVAAIKTDRLNIYQALIPAKLHIRVSVILNWLRQHNKRQVQYMAGHKYIHSTEMYEVQELESLTDALTKYHPFG